MQGSSTVSPLYSPPLSTNDIDVQFLISYQFHPTFMADERGGQRGILLRDPVVW